MGDLFCLLTRWVQPLSGSNGIDPLFGCGTEKWNAYDGQVLVTGQGTACLPDILWHTCPLSLFPHIRTYIGHFYLVKLKHWWHASQHTSAHRKPVKTHVICGGQKYKIPSPMHYLGICYTVYAISCRSNGGNGTCVLHSRIRCSICDHSPRHLFHCRFRFYIDL